MNRQIEFPDSRDDGVRDEYKPIWEQFRLGCSSRWWDLWFPSGFVRTDRDEVDIIERQVRQVIRSK